MDIVLYLNSSSMARCVSALSPKEAKVSSVRKEAGGPATDTGEPEDRGDGEGDGAKEAAAAEA
jgi:hypothetical protein